MIYKEIEKHCVTWVKQGKIICLGKGRTDALKYTKQPNELYEVSIKLIDQELDPIDICILGRKFVMFGNYWDNSTLNKNIDPSNFLEGWAGTYTGTCGSIIDKKDYLFGKQLKEKYLQGKLKYCCENCER